MLTDPISDYLTRVRNALAADHPDVEIPASRLKKEMSRILAEQGYISGFEVEPTAVGEVIRVQLKYTEDRQPVISGGRLCQIAMIGHVVAHFTKQRRQPRRP